MSLGQKNEQKYFNLVSGLYHKAVLQAGWELSAQQSRSFQHLTILSCHGGEMQGANHERSCERACERKRKKMKENRRRWWWCLIFTSCTCSDLDWFSACVICVSFFFERLIQNLRRRLHSKPTLPTWSMPVGREGLGCAPRRCPLRASTAAGHRKFLPRLPSTLSLTWKILEAWLVEVSVETASTASTNNFKKNDQV